MDEHGVVLVLLGHRGHVLRMDTREEMIETSFASIRKAIPKGQVFLERKSRI